MPNLERWAIFFLRLERLCGLSGLYEHQFDCSSERARAARRSFAGRPRSHRVPGSRLSAYGSPGQRGPAAVEPVA